MAESGFHKIRALSHPEEPLGVGPTLRGLALSLPSASFASLDFLHNDKGLRSVANEPAKVS